MKATAEYTSGSTRRGRKKLAGCEGWKSGEAMDVSKEIALLEMENVNNGKKADRTNCGEEQESKNSAFLQARGR